MFVRQTKPLRLKIQSTPAQQPAAYRPAASQVHRRVVIAPRAKDVASAAADAVAADGVEEGAIVAIVPANQVARIVAAHRRALQMTPEIANSSRMKSLTPSSKYIWKRKKFSAIVAPTIQQFSRSHRSTVVKGVSNPLKAIARALDVVVAAVVVVVANEAVKTPRARTAMSPAVVRLLVVIRAVAMLLAALLLAAVLPVVIPVEVNLAVAVPVVRAAVILAAVLPLVETARAVMPAAQRMILISTMCLTK